MNTYTFRVDAIVKVQADSFEEAGELLPEGTENAMLLQVDHGDPDCTAPSYDDVRRENEREEARGR